MPMTTEGRAGCSAGMKNYGAFFERKTGDFEISKRGGGDGRNFLPMVYGNVSCEAEVAVCGNILNLE